ncbi:MAG TPA: hypothetical protein VH796_02535 [Nitrososphaeraceae archaeon]
MSIDSGLFAKLINLISCHPHLIFPIIICALLIPGLLNLMGSPQPDTRLYSFIIILVILGAAITMLLFRPAKWLSAKMVEAAMEELVKTLEMWVHDKENASDSDKKSYQFAIDLLKNRIKHFYSSLDDANA